VDDTQSLATLFPNTPPPLVLSAAGTFLSMGDEGEASPGFRPLPPSKHTAEVWPTNSARWPSSLSLRLHTHRQQPGTRDPIQTLAGQHQPSFFALRVHEGPEGLSRTCTGSALMYLRQYRGQQGGQGV